MDGPNIVDDLIDFHLDILGQLPGLRIYTQLCWCFSVSDDSSRPAIIDTLTDGLKRLSTSFPWIAGQVVNENSGQGHTGTLKIRPFENTPRLIVKDFRNDSLIPTMDVIRRANFPMGMLDENLFAPRKTIPTPDESASEPVFVVQLNFISGGIILTFVGHHSAMDMTGQGEIIRLLSKACYNESFTSEELSTGNLHRQNLIRPLDNREDLELVHQFVRSNNSNPDAVPLILPESTWAYFAFTSSSLVALKSRAIETISHLSDYISTDDALSAFIWQSVTRARIPRLASDTETTLARAVDVRRHLNIPLTYPGLMQNMTYHTYTLQQLVKESLGVVASQLRWAVDSKTSDLEYRTRALATFLNNLPDKSIVSFPAKVDTSKDIMISSWSKVQGYELDFNFGLGKPEAVRRPRLIPFEGLIYFMPRTHDGEIVVAMCLSNEDMERLRVDAEFSKYCHYIG